MRLTASLLVALLAAGCASTGQGGRSDRSLARNVLIGVAAGSAALAVGAAVAGENVESRLRRDYEAGAVSGREFAGRDAEGKRWNRVARASGFVTGLSIIGLGILWEMSIGDRIQRGPREERVQPAPGADQRSTTAR